MVSITDVRIRVPGDSCSGKGKMDRGYGNSPVHRLEEWGVFQQPYGVQKSGNGILPQSGYSFSGGPSVFKGLVHR